ncbi:MAG: flagellar motor protein MotB [Chitinophagaceae bacterium]
MKKVIAVLKLGGFLLLMLQLGACVAKRKLVAAQEAVSQLQSDSAKLAAQLAQSQREFGDMRSKYDDTYNRLNAANNALEASNKNAASAASTAAGTIAQQQRRLETLQRMIDQQRATTDALRKKMADALVGFNSNELSVAVKNGKVYVSLQESLLFPSGSAVVNKKGKEALGKLAGVLILNPDINVNIEGHTDSVPIKGRFEDNWALSVARATAIVRVLTKEYSVDPVRVTATGHSKYDPVADNTTPEGRAQNRRTEIILTPKLDELYKLIEGGATQ